MCTHHISSSRLRMGGFLKSSFLLFGLPIFLGIATGLSDLSTLHELARMIADMFMRMFKCISLPIIALSLITVLSRPITQAAKGIAWRTVTYTLGTTLVASLVSALLYAWINPKNVKHIAEYVGADIAHIHYAKHLSALIPTNIFAPFLEHQVMGVLLVGMTVGLAIRAIPEERARISTQAFFQGAHAIFLVITRWIVAIMPLGLYAFMSCTVLDLKSGHEWLGIGEYLAIILGANLIQGFIVLPLWLASRGLQPFSMMRAMMPALSLAFFSKSSAGTMPVTMAMAETRLKIKPEISRFVLPLCTTINMNGCAAFIFATVMYVMQNQGIAITMETMALWVGISVIAAVGNAGVPMGCFFLSASLLATMNMPITLLGVILPFYAIIDMVETALNVWSDACVAKMVDCDVA